MPPAPRGALEAFVFGAGRPGGGAAAAGGGGASGAEAPMGRRDGIAGRTGERRRSRVDDDLDGVGAVDDPGAGVLLWGNGGPQERAQYDQIGRASCRERVQLPLLV